MKHFVVTRKLFAASEAVGEYTIGSHVVEEILEEVLAMAEVDYMNLVSSFIHDKTLFLIFRTDEFNILPLAPHEVNKLKKKFENKEKYGYAKKRQVERTHTEKVHKTGEKSRKT